MSRPYRTALFAVAIAALTTGFADASPRATQKSPPIANTVANVSNPEDAGQMVPPSESSAFAVSPQLRAKLAALDNASMMPTETADAQMWSDSTVTARHTAATHARARGEAGGDAIHRFASGIISRTSSIAMSLTRSAMRFIGTPYVFGGTSPSGFDCSGYTQHVFAMLGIPLPRTADAQYYAGRPIVGGMTTGDLVFFQTYEPGPSHVGIYVGGGKFIHSSSHGVMISRLDNSYWRARYIGAKRIASFR